MGKYKLCPVCQTKNEPTLFECIQCEADLTRVKITDEEAEQAAALPDPDPDRGPALVRVCDCGQKNPPAARKCSACGEDLSDITPTPDAEPRPAAPVFTLNSLDGQYAWQFCEGELTAGREAAMAEYLAAKPYVSRSQARFTVEEGGLYIEDLSRTNHTFVNNERVTGRVKLEPGDEVGFGGAVVNGARQEDAAYFLVGVGE